MSVGTGIGFRLAIEEWELTLDMTRDVIHRLVEQRQPVNQNPRCIITVKSVAQRAIQLLSLACRAGKTANSAKRIFLPDLSCAASGSLHRSVL
ncbi:MAG: hypothetical protein ACSHXI_01750 [Hoeflea sp.]|uniref:hypothetical protein n=1 Tax=Hoeflea sp. TaxID=1940281 RepID=UPI003EF1B487